MPVDPGDVSLFRGEFEPANYAVGHADQPEFDPRILGAGEGIAVLLDLHAGFSLVHDRVCRDVRFVDLLEGDQLARRRGPVAAQAIEFFLSDEFSQPAGGIRRV